MHAEPDRPVSYRWVFSSGLNLLGIVWPMHDETPDSVISKLGHSGRIAADFWMSDGSRVRVALKRRKPYCPEQLYARQG